MKAGHVMRREDALRAIALLEDGPIDAGVPIGARPPLAQAAEAFACVRARGVVLEVLLVP